MSLTLVLWLVGGWFALAAAASLIIGRMISTCSSGDPQEAVEETTPVQPSAEQVQRPRVAA